MLMEDIKARLQADPVTWERLKAALEMSARGGINGHLCHFSTSRKAYILQALL
jgi:hypothetical protein